MTKTVNPPPRQLTPTPSFQQRAIAAAAGQVYEPAIAFAPNGPVYGRPGYWAKQKTNFAPRSCHRLRAGQQDVYSSRRGMYYDHFGQGIVNAFNSYGSFGLASQTLQRPWCIDDREFTSIHQPHHSSQSSRNNSCAHTDIPVRAAQTNPTSSFRHQLGCR